MAALMVGARRTDGACGTNPRRIESPEPIGGTLRFSRTATTTHSVGRGLAFEPGMFAAAPLNVFWHGDDHSRLVLVDTALPPGGGRLASGNWVEIEWGDQGLGDFVVTPTWLNQGAATIRSVDIGLCSQHEAWTNPATGCGLADRLVRAAESFAFLMVPPPPVVPGLGLCVLTVEAAGLPGATWSYPLGTPTAFPQGTSDLLAARFSIRLSTSGTCLTEIGVPILFGCIYDSVIISFDGSFGTRRDGTGYRDPLFRLGAFDIEVATPGRPQSDLHLCSFPAAIEPYMGLLGDAVRGEITGALDSGLRGAVTQRELSLTTAAPPGSCDGALGPTLDRSNCASPTGGLTPDQACAAFVTGNPFSTGIRARCEIRRTGVECRSDSECGGAPNRTVRRCQLDRRCAGPGATGSVCSSSADCQQGGDCVVVDGECIDAEPVCYWNVEANRVEMLPSGIEVVLAEDEDDPSYGAFSSIGGYGILGVLEEGGVCRGEDPGPFHPPDASGVLGAAGGAPLP